MSDAPALWVAGAVALGCGATAATDLWAVLRKRLLGVPPLDYALVGRWVGHMPRGRFVHGRIADAEPVRGEGALGWCVHYLTGIGFAAVLLTWMGPDWLCRPDILPALAVGIGSVAAPFLLMQPALGAGFAAARTPHPGRARLHSLLTHCVFALGLYLSGLGISLLC